MQLNVYGKGITFPPDIPGPRTASSPAWHGRINPPRRPPSLFITNRACCTPGSMRWTPPGSKSCIDCRHSRFRRLTGNDPHPRQAILACGLGNAAACRLLIAGLRHLQARRQVRPDPETVSTATLPQDTGPGYSGMHHSAPGRHPRVITGSQAVGMAGGIPTASPAAWSAGPVSSIIRVGATVRTPAAGGWPAQRDPVLRGRWIRGANVGYTFCHNRLSNAYVSQEFALHSHYRGDVLRGR